MKKILKPICFILVFFLVYSVVGIELASAKISGSIGFGLKLTGGKLLSFIVPFTMFGLILMALIGMGKQSKSRSSIINRYFSQNPSRSAFKKHVLAGAIVEDMNKDEVILSWGEPQEIYLDLEDSSYGEVWLYPGHYLGFEEDWLVARFHTSD